MWDPNKFQTFPVIKNQIDKDMKNDVDEPGMYLGSATLL